MKNVISSLGSLRSLKSLPRAKSQSAMTKMTIMSISKALTIACTILLCTSAGNTQTTGTFSKARVMDTLTLSGRSLAEVVYTISAASKNNESPTAKAVYAYIQSLGYLATVSTTARISGNGTSGSPLELAQQSATTGQVLRWSGSAWVPNGLNLYDIVTTSQTVTAVNNEVWVNTLSADITLNLPACNSANNGVKITFGKVGTDSHAVTLEPAGSEEFIDGETAKALYSRGTGMSCTCRYSGGTGVWLYINM